MKDMKIDMEEVCLLCKYIFKWRCFKNEKKETSMRLVRWDPKKEADVDNLVLLGKDACEKVRKMESLEAV